MGIKMAKVMMGFEPNRNRVVRVVNAKKTTMTIGGKTYNFRSEFESVWAKYLQFLQDCEQIADWDYEPTKFDFWKFGYRNKPYEYTPDFLITNNDGTTYFQETKGYLETRDNSKYLRMSKHYPDIQIEIVMQRIPKKGKGFQNFAKLKAKSGIIRRIIDASEILKQVKGLI